MKAIEFRVQNFRNIDDSGWIPLERVTAFVGRNESGKTTLLKALHKFNPGTPEPYDPQKDFPRDRYNAQYIAKGSKGGEWPVCSVRFSISEEVQEEIAEVLPEGVKTPNEVIVTRYYDQSLKMQFLPDLSEPSLIPKPIISALNDLSKSIRRLESPTPEQEEATAQLRTTLTQWATACADQLKQVDCLRDAEGVKLLTKIRTEAEAKSNPKIAGQIEELLEVVNPALDEAKEGAITPKIEEIIEDNLPVFIYFENYGILDSAIYLPRFVQDLDRDKTNPRVRTISAMFRHVGLDAKEITNLAAEQARTAQQNGQQPTPAQIAEDQRKKDERAIRLNSASIEISRRFSEWWSQRRHKIRYHADGDYFRIWVADDRRPDVEIELEARSKGFQWFFSFYLVFLVESEDGHKNAILLLDEPGINLHPTAQQELIAFFEKLAEKNQLAYTTHSPFLIDGEHLHRVRPVTEDDSGHSRISVETWPKDRETIFPLQAGAGYAMLKGLFQHKRNVLVEGMSDYYYLHALSQQCAATGRTGLPDDIYITPCGGTKNVGYLASLFLGEDVRPVVLLDNDDAGRVRRDALMKELYVGHNSGILMLDEVTGAPGTEMEIEDLFGEAIILSELNKVAGLAIKLTDADRKKGSLVDHIKAAATRQGVELPDGWKASVAISLVSKWAESGSKLANNILDSAAKVFTAMKEGFVENEKPETASTPQRAVKKKSA